MTPKPKRIVRRIYDPSEPRWVVLFTGHVSESSKPYVACAPHGGDKRGFAALAEACDYARAQQSTTQEVPC